jgi:hypothetical protein
VTTPLDQGKCCSTAYEQPDYDKPRKELSVYLLNRNKMESPDLSNTSTLRIHQAIPTHWADGRPTSTPNGTLMNGDGHVWW